MEHDRFLTLTQAFQRLKIAVIGDFCLDRYLEIDPGREERSIETGRPVHNVVRVRCQPGAAGTILNNLTALRVGQIYPVAFTGEDGEGFELLRVLQSKAGVVLNHFFSTSLCRTFTYTKPLQVEPGQPPRELDRLDFKNWSPTPSVVRSKLIDSVRRLAHEVDAFVLLDQVDEHDTGVITADLLDAVSAIARQHPQLFIIGDSRSRLHQFPRIAYKMNRNELARFIGSEAHLSQPDARYHAERIARENGRHVFVTMAEEGMLGVSPAGVSRSLPASPVRGPIDVVGAGDAVTATLTAALTAGADLEEALELANAAASVVLHQLGTTGTAGPEDLASRVVTSPAHPPPS